MKKQFPQNDYETPPAQEKHRYSRVDAVSGALARWQGCAFQIMGGALCQANSQLPSTFGSLLRRINCAVSWNGACGCLPIVLLKKPCVRSRPISIEIVPPRRPREPVPKQRFSN